MDDVVSLKYKVTSLAFPTLPLMLLTATAVASEMFVSGDVMLTRKSDVSTRKFSTSHTSPVTELATWRTYRRPRMEQTAAIRPMFANIVRGGEEEEEEEEEEGRKKRKKEEKKKIDKRGTTEGKKKKGCGVGVWAGKNEESVSCMIDL